MDPCTLEITDPIAGRAAGHVAPAEWRFLGWLERENFAYDLYSETQLHFDQLDLDQYKVICDERRRRVPPPWDGAAKLRDKITAPLLGAV